MKLQGKHLLVSPKPIGHVDSSIGRLAIYSITFGNLTKLMGTLNGPLSACDPTDFVKRWALYVCHLAETLDKDETRPNDVSLTQDDVDKLNENDLNDISGTFIDYEEGQHRKLMEATKNAEGNPALADGEVEHPKEDGESNIQYFHRLKVLQEEQQREQMEAATKAILGSAHFSQSLSQNIGKILGLTRCRRPIGGLKIDGLKKRAYGRKDSDHSEYDHAHSPCRTISGCYSRAPGVKQTRRSIGWGPFKIFQNFSVI